jgi:hypothetical protein
MPKRFFFKNGCVPSDYVIWGNIRGRGTDPEMMILKK